MAGASQGKPQNGDQCLGRHRSVRAPVQVAQTKESLDGQRQGNEQPVDEQAVGLVMPNVLHAVASFAVVEPLVFNLPPGLGHVEQGLAAAQSRREAGQPVRLVDFPIGLVLSVAHHAHALPLEAFDSIVGDEVDLCFQTFGPLGEQVGLFEGIVDSFDEDVFEGELLLLAGGPVVERVEEIGEGPLIVHRHDPAPHFIGSAVEGDREADLLGVLGEFLDLWCQTGGGDGEAAGADVEAPGRGDGLDGGEEVGEVGQRFAHTHEDEVVDLFTAQLFREQDLPRNFSGGKIAREAIESGGAEFASVGATYL